MKTNITSSTKRIHSPLITAAFVSSLIYVPAVVQFVVIE